MSADADLKRVLKMYAALSMFEGFAIDSPVSPGMDGDTPFHMAAYDGNADALLTMLPAVPDIDCRGGIGNTALHYSFMKCNAEAAGLLIAYGASLAAKNDYGDTPLDFAQSCDDPAIVELLRKAANSPDVSS